MPVFVVFDAASFAPQVFWWLFAPYFPAAFSADRGCLPVTGVEDFPLFLIFLPLHSVEVRFALSFCVTEAFA